MKKLLATAALAAAAAGTLSAEITFGSWGRSLWNTAANSGHNKIINDMHQSWGGSAPRTALSVHGDSENVGFALDIFGNGWDFGRGDNAYIYAKPIEQVTIYAGKMDVNILRGDACFGLWNWDRIGAVNMGGVPGQEGWTFPDILDTDGVSIVARPVEGLTVGAAIPLQLDGTATKVSDTYGRGAKYAVAYSLENLFTVKFGVETQARAYEKKSYLYYDVSSNTIAKANKYDGKDWVQLDAAVDVNAVDNFFFSVGTKIPTIQGKYYSKSRAGDGKKTLLDNYLFNGTSFTVTDFVDAWTYGNQYTYYCPEINAYARFNVTDALTLHGLFGSRIKALDKKIDTKKLERINWINENIIGDDRFYIEDDGTSENNFGFVAGGGVDYNFSNGIGVFADARYANDIYYSSSSADNMGTFTFGVGVQKNFSNGVFGVAFEGTTNNFGRYEITKGDYWLVTGDSTAIKMTRVRGERKASAFAWEIPVKFEYWF